MKIKVVVKRPKYSSWVEVAIVAAGTVFAAFCFALVLLLASAMTEGGNAQGLESHRLFTALVASVLFSVTGIVFLFIPLLVIGLGAGVATRFILRSGMQPKPMAVLGGLLGATTGAAVSGVAYWVFGPIGLSVFRGPTVVLVLLAVVFGGAIGSLYIMIRVTEIART